MVWVYLGLWMECDEGGQGMRECVRFEKGCVMVVQGGMLDGAFYERGGVGACALGQNSYLSPLKVSLVNESSTGEMTYYVMGGFDGCGHYLGVRGMKVGFVKDGQMLYFPYK